MEERSKVGIININKKDISDLKGIEAFPNLTELDCGNNSIQKLDLRQNPMLITLKCNKNQLTQLDLSKNPGYRLSELFREPVGTAGCVASEVGVSRLLEQ